MAPIRKYLRVTKYSVLETRIYLEHPSLAHTWLLGGRNPAMDRIVSAIRPVVKQRLREENEWAVRTARGVTAGASGGGKKGGGGAGMGEKKSGTGDKDVVVGDDFEVSIFFTDHSTRHSLLRRQRDIRPKKNKSRLRAAAAKSGALSGWIVPHDHQTGAQRPPAGQTIESPIALDDVEADTVKAVEKGQSACDDGQDGTELTPIPPSSPISARSSPLREPHSRSDSDSEADADAKKIKFNTTYEGFSINNRVLSLVVKRIDRVAEAVAITLAAKAAREAKAAAKEKPNRGARKGQAARGKRGGGKEKENEKEKEGAALSEGQRTIENFLDPDAGGKTGVVDEGDEGEGECENDGDEAVGDEPSPHPAASHALGQSSRPNMLELWISTQAAAAQRGGDDDDDGDDD